MILFTAVRCENFGFESLQHLSASLRFLSIGHYQFYHAMENEFDFVFFCCCDFISICWVWCVISVFESLQHSNFFSIDDHQVHHCNENKFVFVTLRRTWITNMIVIFFLFILWIQVFEVGNSRDSEGSGVKMGRLRYGDDETSLNLSPWV